MKRVALLAVALAAACADGPPLPPGDVLLQVSAQADEVELGRAFPLTVQRAWNAGLVAEDWDSERLAPLALELEDTRRRERGGRVEETLRYRAYAFELGAVSVPAASFAAKARDGGAELTATSEAFEMRVRGVIDAQAPGDPELPGDPPPAPFPWLPVGVSVAVLAAATFLVARGRRKPSPEAPAPPPPRVDRSHERALARLEALRSAPSEALADVQAFHVEAAATLRAYLHERFAAGTPQMTTEELVDAPVAEHVSGEQQARLAGVLRECDLVKFARAAPGAGERGALLDAACAFVRATAGGAA